MAQATQTTDHETIRKWVEDRQGRPATVAASVQENEEAGILRIDFPGYSGEESLKAISWEEFFEKFDCANLAFLYQEEAEDGTRSRFCKFVNRKPK